MFFESRKLEKKGGKAAERKVRNDISQVRVYVPEREFLREVFISSFFLSCCCHCSGSCFASHRCLCHPSNFIHSAVAEKKVEGVFFAAPFTSLYAVSIHLLHAMADFVFLAKDQNMCINL